MSYEVAAASEDGISVDSHFGQAKIYRIISVEEETGKWSVQKTIKLDWANLIPKGDGGCCGHNEEIIEYVAEQLKGCRYVLVEKIGPRPQKIMNRHGLICLETDERIDEAIDKLQKYHQRFSKKTEQLRK